MLYVVVKSTRTHRSSSNNERAITDGLTEMLKGTLEGCVLQLIGDSETYGYALNHRLIKLGFQDVTEGTV